MDNLVRAKLNKLKSHFPYLAEKSFQFLDFGCGIGNVYAHIKDFFPKASEVCLDLLQKLLAFNPKKRLTCDEAL